MKKNFKIIILIICILMVVLGHGVYKIYRYEQLKNEWIEILDKNNWHFNYVVEWLISQNGTQIAMWDEIEFRESDSREYTKKPLEDKVLHESLKKIKACDIKAIFGTRKTGWRFIRETSGPEIGLYYSDTFSKNEKNHIDGSWFYLNMNYDYRPENTIFRWCYELIFD